MYQITVYTDGACSGNPGAGGWAAILMCNGSTKKISGGETNTTNNRMELQAVIEALKIIKKPSEVTLYSDSAYVINAFTQGWLSNWQKNHWKTSGRKPVQNKELWIELLKLTSIHNVIFKKVKGHADNEFNNECDALARAAIKNL